jgi:hypothetical protein
MAEIFNSAKSLATSNFTTVAMTRLRPGSKTEISFEFAITWWDVTKYPPSVIKKPVPTEVRSLGVGVAFVSLAEGKADSCAQISDGTNTEEKKDSVIARTSLFREKRSLINGISFHQAR